MSTILTRGSSSGLGLGLGVGVGVLILAPALTFLVQILGFRGFRSRLSEEEEEAEEGVGQARRGSRATGARSRRRRGVAASRKFLGRPGGGNGSGGVRCSAWRWSWLAGAERGRNLVCRARGVARPR